MESSWYPARDPQNPHVSLPNWAWDLSPRSSQESYQEKTPCVTVLLPAQLKIQAAQAFSSLDLAQQAWFPMASPADHSKYASTQLEMLTAWRRRDEQLVKLSHVVWSNHSCHCCHCCLYTWLCDTMIFLPSARSVTFPLLSSRLLFFPHSTESILFNLAQRRKHVQHCKHKAAEKTLSKPPGDTKAKAVKTAGGLKHSRTLWNLEWT